MHCSDLISLLTYGDTVCVLISVSTCVFTRDRMNRTINKICQESIYCMTDHFTVAPVLSSGPRCLLKFKIVLNNLIFFFIILCDRWTGHLSTIPTASLLTAEQKNFQCT